MAFSFWTPAKIVDCPTDSTKQAALDAQWNTNLNGFTQQGINGNLWNATYMAGITNYYNPLDTTVPADSVVAPIEWNAFPGRINFYFPNLSANDQRSLADTGYQTNGQTFPPITEDPCSEAKRFLVYGPYGPRGWLDEYCEWSVLRNEEGKIIRVDFTCENPEYYNSLWMIDPETVVAVYQSTLGKPQIKKEDLYLYDLQGKVVTDPSTGRPAYNPLNKWNRGTVSTALHGGAMHLTSTPNTIQTEIGLATSATIQRPAAHSATAQELVCCGTFGQPGRNSDPHIGFVVNSLVGQGNTVTLANPPGLYIQLPDFSSYTTPDRTAASDFWTIVRGESSLTGEDGKPLPGNFILHAKYEVPAAKGYTVSDITIDGDPINWGSQIAQTFNMHIIARAFAKTAPASVPCSGTPSAADKFAQPQQIFYKAVFDAMSQNSVSNPVNQPMTLISNSTFIAPKIAQGASSVDMVITADTVQLSSGALPTVTVEGDDISIEVAGQTTINYAVPGNSYPANVTALLIKVTVNSGAQLGLRNVYVTNSGQAQSTAMPAMLNVVASS